MAALLGKRVKKNLAGSSVLPAQIGNRDTLTIYSAMGWWTMPNTCFSFLFAEDGIKSVSNSMQTQAALSGNHLLRISAFLRARPVEEPDGKGFFEHSNTHQPTFYKQAKWREGVNNQVQKNDEPFWKQEEAITSKRRRFSWGYSERFINLSRMGAMSANTHIDNGKGASQFNKANGACKQNSEEYQENLLVEANGVWWEEG